MIRWLLRIGLGYLVVRMAKAYRTPAPAARARRRHARMSR